MSANPSDSRLADLLAQRGWMRSLARVLVRDEADAEDLEQETWVAALERPPTWTSTPRGWLASVLRRRAARAGRTGARVARRERAAARPEAVASTADVVAQAEQHRLVVDAVWALDEVQRTAVLLRFYEGLPPREIARRTGAPVETVRARVRRGLEEVRAHFDREHRGNRRAWQAALAPLAGVPLAVPVGAAAVATTTAGASAATAVKAAGVFAMASTTSKAAAAVAALVVLGFAGWALWPAGTVPSAGPSPGGGARAAPPRVAIPARSPSKPHV